MNSQMILKSNLSADQNLPKFFYRGLGKAALVFSIFFSLTAPVTYLQAALPEDLSDSRNKVDRQMLEIAALTNSPILTAQAEKIGQQRAEFNHQAALGMLAALDQKDFPLAQRWRAEIDLPKYANSVEGAVALNRLGKNRSQIPQTKQLLARDYLAWQSTRIRQKLDDLLRYSAHSDASLVLLTSRLSEIYHLALVPKKILAEAALAPLQMGKEVDPTLLGKTVKTMTRVSITEFQSSILNTLPNLLTPDDILRKQSLMAKLLRLVPMEYKSGVRAGEIIIPIEYREAILFTQQSKQIFAELSAAWRLEKTELLLKFGPQIDQHFSELEASIKNREDQATIEKKVNQLQAVIKKEFGVGLRKAGKSGEVIAESALEVRTLLSQSMLEAMAGRWRQANALRLEAYTTFDLEIERRVLPRAPDLALQVERLFLDGYKGELGIKAVIDARKSNEEIQAAFQRTLDGLDECVAILRVGLSPQTVSFTAFTIVLREGMEAVVILAALLAGFRGAEHVRTRSNISRGVWLALLASAITFIIGNTLIQGLSRYGETLEAVVSILAVFLLLMVTNWVFHKVYWVEWNARLRELGKMAKKSDDGGFWPQFSMIGVGFLTIYREGFETTLFLQSLILEGGWAASITGLSIGLLVIAILGYAVFIFGAKLPYRKLLVVTGVLVVSIMMTFIGSTVRLFQIVGWLPVHPIEGLQFPTWAGLWLGLYPTYEGFIIPVLGIAYVGGTWLYNKLRVRHEMSKQQTEPVAAKIVELVS